MAKNTQGRTRILSAAYTAPVAAANTTLKGATATSSSAATVITTFSAQPDVPRVLTATAGGTAGDIKAVQVVVEGTNTWGESITESLPAFTVDSAGTVTGTKAFASVTKVTVPAMDGNGATVSVGVGAALGLPDCLSRNTVVAVYRDNSKDSGSFTVTVDSDEVEKNTVKPSASFVPDGTHDIIVDYYK